MKDAGLTEAQLQVAERIDIRGDVLSYDYLTFVRDHPASPMTSSTHILRARSDAVVPIDQVRTYADRSNALLEIAESDEHWFHTNEQIQIVTDWLQRTWTSDTPSRMKRDGPRFMSFPS